MSWMGRDKGWPCLRPECLERIGGEMGRSTWKELEVTAARRPFLITQQRRPEPEKKGYQKALTSGQVRGSRIANPGRGSIQEV